MSDLLSWLIQRHRPIAVSCAVAAFTLGALASQSKTTSLAFWIYVPVAACFTAVSVGLPMLAERAAANRAVTAQEVAERAKQQIRLVVGRVLTPLAYLLGEITDARRHSGTLEGLQGQALQVVLSAATELVEGEGVRACFFRYTNGQPRRLVLAGYYGRAEPASLGFVSGTGLGDEALRLLEEDEDAFYPDLRVEAPPGWDVVRRRHRSLIVIPVTTDKQMFGILTVDSEIPGQLAEQDVELVRLLAELLATGLNK